MGTAASVEGTTKEGLTFQRVATDGGFGNTVIDTSMPVEALPIRETTTAIYDKSNAVRSLISKALKGKFIFQTLTPQQLDDIINVFQPISCVVGENIIEQGEDGEYMYVVESGSFEIIKKGEGKLSSCGVGQTFGELALLYNAKRSASVTCTENAQIWALDRQTFRYYRASNDKRLEKLALDVLAHVPLLKDLQYTQLARAAEVARTVDFEEGDVIISKGEVGHTFYIVLEGVVNCSDASFVDHSRTEDPMDIPPSPKAVQAALSGSGDDDDDRESDGGGGGSGSGGEKRSGGGGGVTLSESKTQSGSETEDASLFMNKRQVSLPAGGVRLKAGEWFGEIALLTGSVRTANVVADSYVRLLAFDRDAFEKVLGSLRDILDTKANNRMLSDLPIIAQLPAHKRDAAVSMFCIETYSNGDVMSSCGDPNPRFILLKSGKASCWKHPDPSLLEVDNDLSDQPIQPPTSYSGGSRQSRNRISSASVGDTWQDSDGEAGSASQTPPHTPLEVQPKVGTVEESTNMISILSIKEVSGEEGGTKGKRSLPNSFERSFEQSLESFEMMSSFNSTSGFGESPMGKAEAKWRRRVQRRHSANAAASSNMNSKSVSEESKQEVKEAESSFEEGKDGEEEGKTFVICAGEHVGSEAIFQGNRMDCTVIAQGEVSCFVLAREDLTLITSIESCDKKDKTGNYKASIASSSFIANQSPTNQRVEEDMANTHEEAPSSSSSSSPTTEGGMGTVSRASAGKVVSTGSIEKHEQIKIDWSKLRNLGQIGAGTFGTVYMMQYEVNGGTFAMKVLDKVKVKKMRQEKRLETEKLLLISMNSPFISKMYDEMADDSAFYLLLELVQGGELKRLIHPTETHLRTNQQREAEAGKLAGIPHQPAKFYAAAISLPLVYLHRRSIAYRDLKPENIMIDRFGYPKLIDFGLAKPLDETGRTHSLCGTPEYLAPQVILGTGHNQAVDWWALGVLLYEMIVGSSPFLERGVDRRKQDHMIIFQNIIENRASYSPLLEPQCADLIQRLLTLKPAFRMGCGVRAHKEFEEHAWFSGVVDWYALRKRQVSPPWFPPLQDQTDRQCFSN